MPATRRRSPRHGSVFDVFSSLVSIPAMLAHPNLTLDVVLTVEEELRALSDRPGRWRRGWARVDRRLVDVVETHTIALMADLFAMIDAELPELFTSNDIAVAMKSGRRLGQKAAYCFREAALARSATRTATPSCIDAWAERILLGMNIGALTASWDVGALLVGTAIMRDAVVERAYEGSQQRAQQLVPFIKNGDQIEETLRQSPLWREKDDPPADRSGRGGAALPHPAGLPAGTGHAGSPAGRRPSGCGPLQPRQRHAARQTDRLGRTRRPVHVGVGG